LAIFFILITVLTIIVAAACTKTPDMFDHDHGTYERCLNQKSLGVYAHKDGEIQKVNSTSEEANDDSTIQPAHEGKIDCSLLKDGLYW
jgi:hypothetical protein